MPDLLLIPLSSKTNKRGTMPIVLRITYDGRRADYRTGRRIEPGQWNQAKQRPKSTAKEAVDLKKKLKKIVGRAEKIADAIRKAHRDNPEGCPPLSARAVADALRVYYRATTSPAAEPHTDPDTYSLLELTRQTYYATGNENTFQGHRQALDMWRKWRTDQPPLPISKLSRAVAKSFVGWLEQQGYAPTSVATFRNNLQALYARAFPDALNPFRRAGTSSNRAAAEAKPRYRLTTEQVEQLRDLPPKTWRQHSVRVVYLTQYYLHGSRVGAVLELRWEQVDFAAGRIRYKSQKRGAWKDVQMPPPLAFLLRTLKPRPAGSVFDLLPDDYPQRDKADRYRLKKLATTRINDYLKKIGRILGVGEVLHSHTARHTFAGHAAGKVPMRTVQKLLAHRKLEMTEHYVGSLSTAELDEAAALIYS